MTGVVHRDDVEAVRRAAGTVSIDVVLSGEGGED
jgi:hypothetical protein